MHVYMYMYITCICVYNYMYVYMYIGTHVHCVYIHVVYTYTCISKFLIHFEAWAIGSRMISVSTIGNTAHHWEYSLSQFTNS